MCLALRYLLLVAVLAGATAASAANFDIPELSVEYGARIEVKKCDADYCTGPAKVTLYRRADKVTVQIFEKPDMQILLEHAKPVVNDSRLYEDQSALIAGDFNFDGTTDLAIRNGNDSGYGGSSYDVYVYNVTRKKFVPAPDLTELASSKLGMFQVDARRKRIITFEKSGCCFHVTSEYAVVPGKGLVLIHSVEEDAMAVDDHVVVTTSDLVGGKMKKQKKTFLVKDYYQRNK